MIDLTKENFDSEIEDFVGVSLIDLYADWCEPCKRLYPIIIEVESEFPTVKFCRINVDKSPELAAAFGVRSIPMLAWVRNGVFEDFTIGLVDKNEIAEMIEKYI